MEPTRIGRRLVFHIVLGSYHKGQEVIDRSTMSGFYVLLILITIQG